MVWNRDICANLDGLFHLKYNWNIISKDKPLNINALCALKSYS